MPELKTDEVAQYLSKVCGEPAKVLRLTALGKHADDPEKDYGYGIPVRVDYTLGDGQTKSAVLHAVIHTMSPGPFGHEHMADRAQEMLWAHQAFNHLPRHVRSLDAGAFLDDGTLISLRNPQELCQLTEYVEGQCYSVDLERLRDSGGLSDLDLARADALCDYLVEIHRVPGTDPGLYVRRIRELVGHGECIMGLTDSYPPHPLIPVQLLERIEHRAVNWRWKLKGLTHRLRQVHGDFHPWNILFQDRTDFRVLDRSRGEFGDPADDVTSLTLNYVFFSLQRSGCLEGNLEALFLRFWDRYLKATGDQEILRVSPPFLAFRGLVMASPLWYPHLPDPIRQKLLTFVEAVLDDDRFDPQRVNKYCGD